MSDEEVIYKTKRYNLIFCILSRRAESNKKTLSGCLTI